MNGAIVGSAKKDQYHIDNGVFWRLVEKGLIRQESRPPFNYILTDVGKIIKL